MAFGTVFMCQNTSGFNCLKKKGGGESSLRSATFNGA